MSSPNRREFLGLAGGAAAAAALASCHLAGRRSSWRAPKTGPLALGVIGVGGRGWDNLHAVAPGETIAALCDVDATHLAAAAALFPQAARFRDYREMIAELELDAVVISTPDHTHAPATLAALRAGLDVYCEKPLTHTIAEAREVAAEAALRGAVTQMGTQIHAGDNYRRVVEAIRAGLIGEVREAHCWVGKAWGGGERPADEPPVPDTLDWNLWLGTAPPRPYHSVYHPAGWRSFWDFGTGTLGDMGCHHLDLPFWALELRRPEAASAQGPPPHAETAPTELRARWEFTARRARDGSFLPAVTLWWHDGGLRPPQFAQGLLPEWGDGTLFVGSEGMLLADYDRCVLLPEEKFADVARPAKIIPSSIGHHKEWLDACRQRGRTTCSFDYAGPLTETVLMGVDAFRARRA
jgi:predicted dehydrogenase